MARQPEWLGAARPNWLCCSRMTFSGKVRVAVYRDLECLFDDFMSKADLHAMSEALDMEVCDWDAMYATAWTVRWRKAPVFLEDAEGRCLAAVNGTALRIGERLVQPDAIVLEVSDDWVRRDIVVVHAAGREVLLSREDLISQVDPTYDFIMLDVETAWMQRLARGLAEQTGAEYRGLR